MIRRLIAVALVATLGLSLAACSDTDRDGDADVDPVKAAEERVERANSALDEAESASAEAGEQFCDDSRDLITAVDRYAGVLTDAEATVGAVVDAGSDLADPREAVGDSADGVAEARGAVVAAEAEVAEAERALAEAQTGTTGADTTTTTTSPLVPDDVVDRVEQAEADLRAAFEGVDESTTLSEATTEVNAAAVAVQVAWVDLFVSAGCLGDEQQAEAVAAVGDYTRALQTALAAAGYFGGEVDGIYGPETVAGVEDLQSDSGLPVTGLVDRATAEALDAAVEAAGGDAAGAAQAHTAALQTVLSLAGYWTGPVDGVWSDALPTAALQALQTDLGVEPTGVVDPLTIAAAQQRLAELQAPPSTSTPTTTSAGEPGDDETTTTVVGSDETTTTG